jgi:hypothetical protein
VPVDSADPLVAAERFAAPNAQAVTGPRSDSEPTGPGTLLWAEAASSGWRAKTDGDNAPRADAFGWTNAFELTEAAPVDLTFAGGLWRLLLYVELLLWIGVAYVWWRSRARTQEGRR